LNPLHDIVLAYGDFDVFVCTLLASTSSALETFFRWQRAV